MNSANNKSSKTWQSPVCCLQKLVTGPKFTIFCQTLWNASPQNELEGPVEAGAGP